MSTPGDRHAAAALSEVGERGLIARIRQRLPPPPPSLIVGIGDDAAVAAPEPGALEVLTTDAMVEGVHFDRRFCSFGDIGYKALAVNISDVAAMAGAPRLALLSLMLPVSITPEDVDAIVDGFVTIADAARVSVAGGNVTRSPGALVIDVTLVGSVRPRKVLLRSGGRPGETLYVTGSIGSATVGLQWLREHVDAGYASPAEADLAKCVERYRRPEPRARIGALLGRTRTASACMDLSDGLADAVRQIAEASGTGARIDATAIPVTPAAAQWFRSHGIDAACAAVSGGDDYELLFAVSRRRAKGLKAVERLARGVPITRIGELTSNPEVVLEKDGRLEPMPRGFTHF